MRIGDRCFVHGYIDEIRKDTIIIRNNGGYFGTNPDEVIVVNDTAHPNWIPCKEKLPEEEGRYLVTDDAGGVKTVQDDEFLHYEDGTPLWLYSQNVTAWMPLPNPYRGGQNDTD